MCRAKQLPIRSGLRKTNTCRAAAKTDRARAFDMIHQNFVSMVQSASPGSGLRYRGETVTYGEALSRIRSLANGFRAQGIGTGDGVAVLLPNSPELFVVVHALFAIGAIAMPLSTGATRQECAHAVGKSSAVAIVASSALSALAQSLEPSLSGKLSQKVFLTEGVGAGSIGNLGKMPDEPLRAVSGDLPALYLTSSGTTGSPKIVVHTQGGLLEDAKRTSRAWQLSPDDVVFNMLPGNFALGLLLGISNAPEVGASVVYWHDARPLVLAREALLATLVAENVSVIAAVPAMYETLAATAGSFDLSKIRLSFSGGAALSREVFDNCRDRLGLTIRQAYGLTEAVMVAHNDSPDLETTWRSVGRPAGNAQVKIDRYDDRLPPGVGELMVKSSSMMKGYLDDEEETRACFSDGWLLTGDLARLDGAGNIYIVGRRKLLIEVLGYKIDPIEVEQILQEHENIAEAVVIGTGQDDAAGQRLKAVIVPRKGEIAPEELKNFLRKRLSNYKVPTLFEFREELPKSSTGKILRGQLTSGK